jgi:hypothetical protein
MGDHRETTPHPDYNGNLGKIMSDQQPRSHITLVLAATLWSLIARADPASHDHWSFIPPQRPPVPAVGNDTFPRNAVDHFVLARLESENVDPSSQADRWTLIRRLSFDLSGLPPSPEEVLRFVDDLRPDAYERAVERLLASPHYGERWARPWLDLLHYADSDGYLTDQLRPHAWRYRHWLVEAMNRNVPFDQFTIEQMAGDLIPATTIEQRVATGFHRNTLSNREGGADLEEFRVEKIVDRVRTTGTVWLGLTLTCARCHDHKYDPLSQNEYYRLFACLNSADEINIDAPTEEDVVPSRETLDAYYEKRTALLAPVVNDLERLQAEWENRLLAAAAHPGNEHLWDRAWEVLGLIWGGGEGEGQLEGQRIVSTPPSQRTRSQSARLRDYFLRRGDAVLDEKFEELKLSEFKTKLDEVRATIPYVTRAQTMEESTTTRPTYVHVRGNFRTPGKEVQPGTPAVLPPLPDGPEPARMRLARWLVSESNPLPARVTVNRIWQEFFGRGLVTTPEDFGTRGIRPSHPELLDWLATELITNGWDIKALQRKIVLSATYRQSSTARLDLAERDPDNALLARQKRLRLSAELVRDAALAASGLLTARIGGPSVRPPQPDSVSEEGYDNHWKVSEGSDRYRRGLYTFIQRTTPFAQLTTFDAPSPSQTCARRERSNTPLQALTLLNDENFFEAARALAQRLEREVPGKDSAQRVHRGFLVCVGRFPELVECQTLLVYLERQTRILATDDGVDEQLSPENTAWIGLASVLLNLDEFITRE